MSEKDKQPAQPETLPRTPLEQARALWEALDKHRWSRDLSPRDRAALDRLREAAADLLHTLYETQGQ